MWGCLFSKLTERMRDGGSSFCIWGSWRLDRRPDFSYLPRVPQQSWESNPCWSLTARVHQVTVNPPENWLERCWVGWAADVWFPSICPALDSICSQMECGGPRKPWAQRHCCLLKYRGAQGNLLLEAGLFSSDKRIVTGEKKLPVLKESPNFGCGIPWCLCEFRAPGFNLTLSLGNLISKS